MTVMRPGWAANNSLQGADNSTGDAAPTGFPDPTFTLRPSVKLTVREDESVQTENSTSGLKQYQTTLYLM